METQAHHIWPKSVWKRSELIDQLKELNLIDGKDQDSAQNLIDLPSETPLDWKWR